MQYIVMDTSDKRNLQGEWAINGVGKNVSHRFGYGLLDAYKMVQKAKDWINVPEQKMCETISKINISE